MAGFKEGALQLKKRNTTLPSDPGTIKVYINTDNKLYTVDEFGTSAFVDTTTSGTSGIGYTLITSGNNLVIATSGLNQIIDLKPTTVTSGSYGSNISVPVITIDSFGRIVSATNTPISASGFGTVTSVSVSSTTLSGGGTITTMGTINVGLSAITTSGIHTKIVNDIYGRVISATDITSADIPQLPPTKITTNTTNRFVTDTQITNWNNAYTSAHSHSNKATLDLINQSLNTSANISANSFVGVATKALSAAEADILNTARSISINGELTSTTPLFDGSQNIIISATISSGINATKIADGSISNTEFQHLNNVSANIQTQLTTLSANKADKTISITAGTMLSGGGDLSTNRTISHQTVGTAGTYSNIVTNSTGHITSARALISADIPTLPPSKILEDANDRFVSDVQINSWNSAVTSSHNHANKATLDLINQDLNTSANVKFNSVSAVSMSADYIDFNVSANPSHVVGRLHWAEEDKTLDLDLEDGTMLQIGQETLIRAQNNTGATILNGQVVYINGAQGNRATVGLADSDILSASSVIAMATQNVLNNNTGFFTAFGLVRDLNTNAFNEGDEIYLSSAAGGFTNIMPNYPQNKVSVGYIIRKHATNGSVFFNAQHISKYEESITTPNELNYVSGVSANIQEQINNLGNSSNKADVTIVISGTSGLIGGGNLSANRNIGMPNVGTPGTYTKVSTDQYGRVSAATNITSADVPVLPATKIADGSISDIEFQYLNNLSANIQTQLITLSATKTNISTTITAGTMLSGGGDLSTNRTISHQTVGTAGTYSNIVTNSTGHITSARALISADIPTLPATKIGTGIISDTEFNHLDTVSANIQTQLTNLSGSKADVSLLNSYLPLSGGNVTGTISATAFVDTNFVGNRAIISDASKTLIESSVTNTELSYLTNVSANIQTQINQLSQLAVSGNGAGTPNRLTKFVTSSSMGDSSITDTGSLVTFTTPVSSNNTITAPNFTGLASRATSAFQADTLKTARNFSLSGAITSNVVSFDGSGNVVLSGTLISGIDATKIADGSVTNTEFQYINTLSANVQTQINSLSSTSHTHTNKSTLDVINQSLNTSATVKFGLIDLGTGIGIGTVGDTSWLKVADFPDTLANTSRKYYISLYGGDWADNGKLNYLLDTYNTGLSQSGFSIKRTDSTWKHANNEIYSNLEWKVLRDNSTYDYMVFVRGETVDYFTLGADVKYTQGTWGTFQYYVTTSATIPTSATHTEIPVAVLEQPVRTLQDSLFIRNFANSRGFGYDYTDTSAVAEVRFNGTSLYSPIGYDLGRTTTPWKDIIISGTYYDLSFAGSRALVSDSNGGIIESSVTSAQINYLNTTSANIQTQFNNLSATDTTINNKFNSYLPLSGGTLTGDLTISKISPKLILNDTDGIAGTYPSIQFDTTNNQGVSLEYNEFDGELPIAGYGLILKQSPNNIQFPGTGTISFSVLGEMYSGSSATSSVSRVLNQSNFQTLYPDLSNIESLAGTSGVLIKTASNTWALDTSTNKFTSAISILSAPSQTFTVNHNLGYLRPQISLVDETNNQTILISPDYISTNQLSFTLNSRQARTAIVIIQI